MPRVPGQVLPTVQRTPLSVPYRSAHGADTLSAFGGDIAQAVTRSSDVLSNTILKQQIEDNERNAKEWDVKFSSRIREIEQGISEDGSDGFYNTRGENTVKQAELTKKAIEEARRELEQSAPNERVRQLFSLAAERRKEDAFSGIDKYTNEQRRVANDTVSETRLQEAADDAAASWHDPEIVGRSISIVQSEVSDLAERNGWSPEVTASKMEAAKTAVYRQSVLQALRVNPASAQAFYDKHKSEIDGTARAEIEGLLEEGVLRQKSQQEADRIMSLTGTDDEKRAEARSIKDPKVRDETVSRVNRRIAEVKQNRVDQLGEAARAAFSFVWQGGSVDDFASQNPKQYELLLSDNASMVNLREAEDAVSTGQLFARTSDGKTMAEIELMDPEKLAQVNPDMYRARLTRAEWGRAVTLIAGAKSSLDVTQANHEVYNRGEAALKDYAPVWLKWGSKDQSERLRAQQHAVQHEMNAYIAAEIDRNHVPTVPELAAKASELLTTIKVDEGWFSREYAAPAGAFPSFTPSQRAGAFMDFEDVPQDLVDAITAELSSRGADVGSMSERRLQSWIEKIAFTQFTGDREGQVKLFEQAVRENGPATR